MKKKCCYETPFKKVTHVIFDLDGTLLGKTDTECLIENVLTGICNEYQKVFTDEMHHRTAGAVVPDIAKMLIAEAHLPLTVEEFETVYDEKFKELCSNIDMMPGAEKLVRHLHENDIPIAVATSSSEEHMVLKTQANRELFEVFHHIVCGGTDPMVRRGKPAPDIFLVCASRFDDKPEASKCLVIEDAPNGVKGALAAGMQVVMVPDPSVPYEVWKGATVKLESMEFMAPELFGLPPFEVMGTPVPRISFSLLSEEDTKGVNLWEKIRKEVREAMVSEGEGAKKESHEPLEELEDVADGEVE